MTRLRHRRTPGRQCTHTYKYAWMATCLLGCRRPSRGLLISPKRVEIHVVDNSASVWNANAGLRSVATAINQHAARESAQSHGARDGWRRTAMCHLDLREVQPPPNRKRLETPSAARRSPRDELDDASINGALSRSLSCQAEHPAARRTA
jgi:hypothetical protein